jgi:ELWxxDGT repeat protein
MPTYILSARFKTVLWLFCTAFLAQNASAQLTKVKEINLTGDPNANTVFVNNGIYYFSANDGMHGQEIWRSDGTEDGTFLLKDIAAGSEGLPNPPLFAALGNKTYFGLGRSFSSFELWETDGSSDGTKLVKSISGPGYSSQNEFVAAGGKIYFFAYDQINSKELWVSNGTTVGTKVVKDISTGTPRYLVAMGNKVAFFHDSGFNFWVSDGTAAGTKMLKAIGSPTAFGGSTIAATPIGFFFGADDSINGYELWFSDGTEAGTNLVKDIYPGGGGNFGTDLKSVGGKENFAFYNGKFYFVGNTPDQGQELWFTDGTEAGTALLKDASPGTNSSTIGNGFVAYKDKLYFSSQTYNGGNELWVTDGTTTGTKEVKALSPGASSGLSSYNIDLTPYVNKLWFACYPDQPNEGDEICSSDGTETGTNRALDIWAGSSSSEPKYIRLVADKLVFFAKQSPDDWELFSYRDPSVATFTPGAAKSLSIAPNPIEEQFRVHAPWLDGQAAEACLIGADGRTVRHWQQVANGQNLSVPGLLPGLYWLQLHCQDGTKAVIKVVK